MKWTIHLVLIEKPFLLLKELSYKAMGPITLSLENKEIKSKRILHFSRKLLKQEPQMQKTIFFLKQLVENTNN